MASCPTEAQLANSVYCIAYGSTSSSTPAGSLKFYMNWVTSKCVQDCVGSAHCGGLAEFGDDLYDTREECCSEKYGLGYLLRSMAERIDKEVM